MITSQIPDKRLLLVKQIFLVKIMADGYSKSKVWLYLLIPSRQ